MRGFGEWSMVVGEGLVSNAGAWDSRKRKLSFSTRIRG